MIPLDAVESGQNCGFFSPRCGIDVATPVVSVVGAERALVTFGWPHLSSEAVDGSGNVSAITTVTRQAPFADPYALNGSQVESGGDRVLVAWGGGCKNAAVWAASWWHGRWTAPSKLAGPAAGTCLENVTAQVNDRGHASVLWGRYPDRPTLDVTTYASFGP